MQQSSFEPSDQTRKITPLDIISKSGCKVQSLTVSDQHATLLLSHSIQIKHEGDDQSTITKTIQSLLKLALIPYHKEILGSNPVISTEDLEKGQLPERNSLQHNPSASEDIISFLSNYDFELKSESGAEYSYYAARPKLDVVKKVSNEKERGDDSTKNEQPPSSTGGIIPNLGAFDIELITPASPKQITRALPTPGHILITETPHLYNTIIKPYVQTIVDSGSLSWIENIVQLKKEKERLLLNHEEFVINVDTKWRTHPPPLTTPRKEWYQHSSTVDLYCLGIVKTSDITCLRDLRSKHIPMLQSMQSEGLNTIQNVYGVDKNQIRVFVHYQPQFYHFHVHYTRLENEVGCSVERAHLVSDILQNLELDDEYYMKRNMSYKVKRGTELFSLIESYTE